MTNDPQTVKQLGERLAQAGHALKPRTIQTALGELEPATGHPPPGALASPEVTAMPVPVSMEARDAWGG